MKLSYRGVAYENNQANLEVAEGEILGKYRGANWRCHTVQEMPVPQPSQTLRYRGSTYRHLGEPVMLRQTPGTHNSSTLTTASLFGEIGRIHNSNLRQNLEHRLQVARARGDHQLVSLLEAESRQLAL